MDQIFADAAAHPVFALEQNDNRKLLDRAKYLFSFAHDPAHYEAMAKQLKFRNAAPAPIGDAQAMLHSGNFGLAKDLAQHGSTYAKIFWVPEARKQRRRSILWPRAVNAHLRPMFTSTVKDAILACALGENRHVKCYDLKAGFYQLPLGPLVREFYAAPTEKGMIVPLRVPMGVTYAPDLLEALLTILALMAVWNTTVTYNVHVDNIRFASRDAESLVVATREFERLCRKFGVTTTTETNEVYLGAEYDYRHPQGVAVRPSPDARARMRASAQDMFGSTPTWGAVMEVFSRAVYLSRIRREPLGGWYNVIKFIRRKASSYGDAYDMSCPIWPSIVEEWKAWIHMLVEDDSFVYHPPHTPRDDYIMFVDASTTGYGAVLVDQRGTVYELAGKWASQQLSTAINTLEATAVAIAAERFTPILTEAKSLAVVVDNTSTLYALKKGSAASGLLNEAAMRALKNLPRDIPVRTMWIPSGKNPGDAPSRGREVSLVDLWSACGLVTEARSRSSFRVATAGRPVHPVGDYSSARGLVAGAGAPARVLGAGRRCTTSRTINP